MRVYVVFDFPDINGSEDSTIVDNAINILIDDLKKLEHTWYVDDITVEE